MTDPHHTGQSTPAALPFTRSIPPARPGARRTRASMTHADHLHDTCRTRVLTRPLLAEFRRGGVTDGTPLFLPGGITLSTAEDLLRLNLQRTPDLTLIPCGVQGYGLGQHLQYTAGTCSVHLWPVQTLDDL